MWLLCWFSEYIDIDIFSNLDEKDEYDAEFDRMREATMKSRQEKAKEELASVLETIEDLKKKLLSAKEQVTFNSFDEYLP